MYLVTASCTDYDDFGFWNVALYNSKDLAEGHAENAKAYNRTALEESEKIKTAKEYHEFWDNFENPWDLHCQYKDNLVHYSVEEIEVED